MVHVHGRVVQQQVLASRGGPLEQSVVVAVDAAKASAVALVADFTGERLCPPVSFAMNRDGIAGLVTAVQRAVACRDVRLVRLGVEASGYHLPLLAPDALPASWNVVELNPAHVAMQRRVNGQRGVKTDLVDATAMFDLLVAGRGSVVATRDDIVAQVSAWVHQRRRQVEWKRAVGNHLLSQLDRAFPGVSGCFNHILGTAAGRLIIAEFTDPARLARLGVERFRRFARVRGVRVASDKAAQLVDAAHQALPAAGASVARAAVAADLRLLRELEAQIVAADQQLELLLPATPFAVLTTTPGWATIRACMYGAAVGDIGRWASARKLYRASGLTPSMYESAGHRRDGGISREGSVALRHALLELGQGLRHHEPAARRTAAQLGARGKHSMIIWTTMANRANRIAYAMVRQQQPYDASRWG